MYLIQFQGDSYSFVKEFDNLIDKAYPVEASRFRYLNFSMCCFIPFCCSVTCIYIACRYCLLYDGNVFVAWVLQVRRAEVVTK